MKLFQFALMVMLVGLLGCTETARAPADTDTVSRSDGPRILAMGDSLMAWHGLTGQSIAHSVARELQEPVLNKAVSGAHVIYKLPISGAMGMKIANQFDEDEWDWVVLTGGGNDLWLGCGCRRCERRLDRMISQDGRKGAIPGMLAKIRQTGARIVYVGYMRSPGVGSGIDECRSEGDVLEGRIARLAEFADGVYFLSLKDLVPEGDRSYHGIDMIHPSVKATGEIGRRVADLIRQEDQKRD